MPILALCLGLAACGGGSTDIDEIEYPTLGTWTGTTAGGVWVEATINNEGSECCLRYASGLGRIAAEDDTLQLTVLGIVNVDQVTLTFRLTDDISLVGQFLGHFSESDELSGMIQGPEAFGYPPLGPLPGEGVRLELHRR